MKAEDMFKNFLIMAFSIIIIIAIYQGTVNVLNLNQLQLFNNQEKYEEQTKIGPINISGLTSEEAESLLRDKADEWKSNAVLSIIDTNGQALDVPIELVTFDIEKTMNNVKNARQNEIIIAAPTLVNEVSSLYEADTFVDIDAITEEIIINCASLNPRVEIFAEDFKVEEGTLVVAESVVTNYTKDNYLSTWISVLNNKVIAANETTTLLTLLENEENKIVASESLNVIATALYKALLHTNFVILERHTSSTLPQYANLGYEAYVIPNELDLAFKNVNEVNYVIQIFEANNALSVSIVGPKFPLRYVVTIKDKKVLNPKTIVHYSQSMKENEIRVTNEGQPGYICKIYRGAFDAEDNLVSNLLIAEDFYAPVHRVEIRYGIEKNPQ